MATPKFDSRGRELLPDDVFQKLHGMEDAEFDQLLEEDKAAYRATSDYHGQQRQGDFSVQSITTLDGESFAEKMEYYRRARSQKPR